MIWGMLKGMELQTHEKQKPEVGVEHLICLQMVCLFLAVLYSHQCSCLKSILELEAR